MLFVHDDQAQILEGQEDAGPHAKNELVRLMGCLPLIDLQALGIRELRMIHPHLVAKEASETFCDLGGQGNFGEEVKDLFALL